MQRPSSWRQGDGFARRRGSPLIEDCDVRPRDCVPTHGRVRVCSRSTAQQTATTAAGLELGSDDGLDGTIGFDGNQSRDVDPIDDRFHLPSGVDGGHRFGDRARVRGGRVLALWPTAGKRAEAWMQKSDRSSLAAHARDERRKCFTPVVGLSLCDFGGGSLIGPLRGRGSLARERSTHPADRSATMSQLPRTRARTLVTW